MTRRAAALFDAAAGRILGWAEGAGGRPARVLIEVADRPALTLVAAAPVEALGAATLAALGPPPDASSAFSARLPPHDGAWPVTVRVVLEGGAALLERRFGDAADYARFEAGRGAADCLTVTTPRLRAGVLSAELTAHGGGAPPDLTIRVRGETVGAPSLTPAGDGRWRLSAPLPAAALSDGVSVIEIALPGGPALARCPVSAGAALAGDLATEVAALRAELDQLKTAFRDTLAAGVIGRDERPMIIAEVLEHVDNLIAASEGAPPADDAVNAVDEWEEET